MSVTNRHLRARVERLVAKWRPIMGLESWDIAVRFDEAKYLATAVVKLRYEEATLHFNLNRMRAELPNTLAAYEELCVHELGHCHEAPHDSETRVSRLTRSLLRARDSAIS